MDYTIYDMSSVVISIQLPMYGYAAMQLEKEFDLKIISLIRGKKAQNCIGISILEREVANEFPEDYIIQPEDALVCYGLYANFMKFWKSIR